MTYYQVYEMKEEDEFALTPICQCATEQDARLMISLGNGARSWVRMDLPAPSKLPNFQEKSW